METLYDCVDAEIFEERIVILLGKTGAGKSSLANLIIGKTVFDAGGAFGSGTSKPNQKQVKLMLPSRSDGQGTKSPYCFRIVDTPGLFDTTKVTNEEIADRIFDFVELELTKVNMIMFVLKYGRFTEEEIETFKFLKKMIGNEATKCCCLIITNAEKLPENNRLKLLNEIEHEPKYKELRDLKNFCKLGVLFCGNIGTEEDPEEASPKVIERIQNDQTKLRELIRDSSAEQYRTRLLEFSKMRADRKDKEIREKIKKDIERSRKEESGGCILL